MVCTIHGKHSYLCIGLAQSIHCAMMLLTRAVGHCHVRLTPSNTRQSSAMLFILYAVLQKCGFLGNGTNI